MRHYIFGDFVEEAFLSREKIIEILETAHQIKSTIANFPVLNILRIFSRIRLNWLDRAYPLRKKVMDELPQLIGFHPRMVDLGLEQFCDLLKAEHLNQKLFLELGGREYLDKFIYRPDLGGYLYAQPLGVVLHVAAGNVFLNSVDSLIHGLLTKNVNILKLSSGDPLFPLLFAESIKEVDKEGILSRSFAILNFRGGETEIEAEFKKRCNAIVVWGGHATLASYRKDLPVGTKLIEYGPKYSFAIITEQGLRIFPLSHVCHKLARDIVLWEQRACSSPQVIYLERNGKQEPPLEFMKCLSQSLIELEKTLPQGRLSLDEKIEITKARELAKFKEIEGEGLLMASPGSTEWTIIYENSSEYKISPLNRTIYVKYYDTIEEIISRMEGFGPYLQTVGILASPQETTMIFRQLAALGAVRFTEIGKMGEGKIGAPHDGYYQLETLVKWVVIEKERKSEEILLEEEEPRYSQYIWEKLKEVYDYAKEKSPFYRERLKNIELESWEDMHKVPLLEREDLYHNAPPISERILTGKLKKAYVFSSGGTTGKPKFSFYFYDELNQITEILAKFYRIAGIRAGDIVGNLFMAGNLWTSFIAVNKALEGIGCVNLPIAGNIELKQLIHYLRMFKANTLIGIPSILISLAEYVLAHKEESIRIQKVLYGGEHLTSDARELISTALGAEMIVSAGYASVDGGPIGYQCPRCQGTVHHLLTDYQFMEILDLENQLPLPPGKIGEIVVTNLGRHLMPFIRYRTGDLGRWMEYKCSCGRISPLFELLGRCDDVVRVGTVDIYPDGIDRAITTVGKTSHLFQVLVEKKKNKDLLTIIIEVDQGLEDNMEISSLLEQELMRDNAELKEALAKGWLAELRVRLVPRGSIPRVAKTGKIQKVVDKR